MGNQRLDRLDSYPFARLRTLLDGLTPAPGAEPVDMTIGEPKTPLPALLADHLRGDDPGWSRYPPIAGTDALRASIAGWLTRRYALPEGAIDPDTMVLPVSGTREALYLLAQTVITPPVAGMPGTGNDAPLVLLPNPCYAVYLAATVMAGAEPVYLPATAANGFLPSLDPEAGHGPDAGLLERTRLAYLCSPANPQGTVASDRELARAIDLARTHDFVLAVDECYAEIYRSAPPPGVLAECVGEDGGFNPRNVIVFHSLSKRSGVPGLRSGFVAGDPEIIARFKALRSFAAVAMPLPVQAASAALWADDAHVRANRARYAGNLALAERYFGGRRGFIAPQAGFFAWVPVGDDEAAARTLWETEAIRSLPGRYLGADPAGSVGPEDPSTGNPGAGYLRLALVHDTETVERALACAATRVSTDVSTFQPRR